MLLFLAVLALYITGVMQGQRYTKRSLGYDVGAPWYVIPWTLAGIFLVFQEVA